MTQFAMFALFLCFGVCTLIIWPLMIHPTLPAKRKMLWMGLTFFILVPGALVLYAWVGVPRMAS